MKTIATALLVLIASPCCALAAPPLDAAAMGPLVFTPAERAAIELTRERYRDNLIGAGQDNAAPVEARAYVPAWVSVRGVARRRPGPDVVWLDEVVVEDGGRWKDYRVRILRTGVRLVDVEGRYLDVPVGARFEPRLRQVVSPLVLNAEPSS